MQNSSYQLQLNIIKQHHKMTDYFVFCKYSESLCPRVMLIPLDKFQTKMVDAYDKLLMLGTKIESCYEWKERKGFHIGYKTNMNNKIDNIFDNKIDNEIDNEIANEIDNEIDKSETTRKIIDFWFGILSSLDHDSGFYPDDYLFYYINDANSECSPNELYDKLSLMTEYCGKKINVKSCVMISEVSFNKVKVVQLRFLCQKTDIDTHTSNDIIKALSKDNRIGGVLCAKNDNDDKFCGYGFVKLKDHRDYDALYKHSLVIDDINFYFD